jgi:hypothetical protein
VGIIMAMIWLKDNDDGTKVFMGMVEIEVKRYSNHIINHVV